MAWARIKWPLFWTVFVAAELPDFVAIRQVSGSSMKPTLNPDVSTTRDYVLIDKTPITWVNSRPIKRGDIVSCRSIEDPRQVNVKRVIGLAGDTITTRGSKPKTEVLIPEGRIWIEGDESFRSRDSNTYGPVPVACVQGRVFAILWPPSRAGLLSHKELIIERLKRERTCDVQLPRRWLLRGRGDGYMSCFTETSSEMLGNVARGNLHLPTTWF